MQFRMMLVTLIALLLVAPVSATETENQGMRVLAPRSKVVIDGKTDDWDLSAGMLACPDVENQREETAIWLHTMWDKDYLYVLARFTDLTPLNNPGQTVADYGFNGDSLQFRIITNAGGKEPFGNHFTCWHGVDNTDVIKIEKGVTFKGGVLKDAKLEGALQAFTVNADGRGYVQEIALPWKFVTADGQPLKPGDSFRMTFEPNFTIGRKGRVSVKELFEPGERVDRIFTFMASRCWGTATLLSQTSVDPQPLRLSDGRTFKVHMDKGEPRVDWTGLDQSREPEGFKPITFTMPEDGHLSLHLLNSDGQVVCQLLNDAFYTAGEHTVMWDGLGSWSARQPGDTLEPGAYSWKAIWHKGIGLRLTGWACNGGIAPWDGATGKENWGGDHGSPIAAAADGSRVYLGWSGAEAGKALLCVDKKGNVQWSNNRAGISGVKAMASDGKVVYVLGGKSGEASGGGAIYKLSTRDGSYRTWDDPVRKDIADIIVKELWGEGQTGPTKADDIALCGDAIVLSFNEAGKLALLDTKTGKLIKTIDAPAPTAMATLDATHVAVISNANSVLAIDVTNGQSKALLANVPNMKALAVHGENVFVALGEPDNRVHVYSMEGKEIRTIGREGGRAKLGKWNPDGMAFVSSIAVDADGKLWVSERDGAPKRMSVWDTASGAFVDEFFGPSSYGAVGGAICPTDPMVMVGQGCEWRLDPATGRAACVSVITRDGMNNSRFGRGSNGRLYLAVCEGWIHGPSDVTIFERVGEGDYKRRAAFHYSGKDKEAKTRFWADRNGDEKEQDDESVTIDGTLYFSRWYMNFSPDMTITCRDGRMLSVTGYTDCGAPLWNVQSPKMITPNGVVSADGTMELLNAAYNADFSESKCVDTASGKVLWSYPNNYVGVHGSHNAIPPEIGLIRGAYEPCGVAKLPEPIGNIWVIPTNMGEWHILTGDGFYLTRLFQPDQLKVRWPEQAVPGAIMDNTPPGMGGEDFGGSVTLADDGNLYVQAGKTGFWNVRIVGLDTVIALGNGSVSLSADDVTKSRGYRERALQAAIGTPTMTIRHATPKFTGALGRDFAGDRGVNFMKQDEAKVRFVGAWDEAKLYLGYEVADPTPWVNGAEDATSMYLNGDTVDFQLAADPAAKPDRKDAAAGDLRLSIGDFKGTPTAVLYRPVWTDKHPHTFSSGVIKDYTLDSVTRLDGVDIKVTKSSRGYTIEAAIPLASLGLTLKPGMTLRGDIGVTHGDAAGKRTRLRTYWANQHTGIVDDAVFELMLEPRYWGDMKFEP